LVYEFFHLLDKSTSRGYGFREGDRDFREGIREVFLITAGE